jgi:NAD(P)H-hydrate epimerase
MLLYPAATYVGELWVAHIGIPPSILADVGARYHVMTKQQFFYWLPHRSPQANKRTAGDVVIIGGSRQFVGAPVLSAIAAQRAGAGYVTVVCPPDAAAAVSHHLVEQIVTPWPEGDVAAVVDSLLEATRHAGAVVIGPGLGREERTQEIVRRFVKETMRPLVVDADALYALAGHLDVVAGKKAVLTPHDGEFSRLLDDRADSAITNRIKAADDFATSLDATLLLKGPRSIIATKEATYVNLTGNELLATAGSGDVLSGMVAAMMGAGCSSRQAAAIAAYWHGVAADYLRDQKKHSIVAGDISSVLQEALHWLDEQEEEDDGYLTRVV